MKIKLELDAEPEELQSLLHSLLQKRLALPVAK